MFENPVVTGEQILRAIPGAVQRTLNASPTIKGSTVGVAFMGNGAKCQIGRVAVPAAKPTKKNLNPLPGWRVTGQIYLPGVDPAARIPRHVALDFMTYGVHEVAHGIFTDRRAVDEMLAGLVLELGAAFPGRVSKAGLHRLWNCIEDPRIEGAMVRHGLARGYAEIGRNLVNKHWAEGAAQRKQACADDGSARAWSLLPVSIAYVGRQWLAPEIRASMRAELPGCILPALDAACAALAALHVPGVRSLHQDADGQAQRTDVLPILRAVAVAMLNACAPADAPEGDSGDEAGEQGEGAPDLTAGPQPQPGKQPKPRAEPPQSTPDEQDEQPAGEGSDEAGDDAGDDSGEPGDEGDEGDEGEGEGDEGDDEGEGDDAAGNGSMPGDGDEAGEQPGADAGDGDEGGSTPDEAVKQSDKAPAVGGSNQEGSAKGDGPPLGLDLTGEGLDAIGAPEADTVTAPDVTPDLLRKIGADNPLAPYGDATGSDRIAPVDDQERDAHLRDARASLKNPGGVAYQLRRLLSKTETSEYRRGLSHGRLRIAALPRALASGAGAFQRRLEFGSDRVSIAVAVDTSGSMAGGCGEKRTMSRATAAGHVLAVLFDALRGCTGSRAMAYGFGGSVDQDAFGRQIFRAETIKEWGGTYHQGLARAASVRMAPHGGTPIRPAIAHGLKQLKAQPAGRKFLIVITDADFGNTQNEQALIKQAERAGIVCIGVGIGDTSSSSIGAIFRKHSIQVGDASELSEKMLRVLADAVLAEGVMHAA